MFVSKPKPTAASSQARAIAHRGVSGKRTDTRWKAELMHTFGPKAEHVEFHGDPVARAACEQLGVRAYAFGDRVATRESSPPLRVAAHEAYHVLHSRADADANEEARAHDSERVALAGNTIEANTPERAPSTRPPLSFYEEWNYDSPSYAESPKWIPGLNYKGEGVRLSDDGNIAIKQDTKKASTRQQYIYTEDSMASKTNEMFETIGSPYRLYVAERQVSIPNGKIEGYNSKYTKGYSIKREEGEVNGNTCGGSGEELKTVPDCRVHAWDVLAIGSDRGLVLDVEGIPAKYQEPTKHPALQLAMLMNWFADLLEESRSDLGRSASPERREKFSRLQKLYQSYRKRTQYWANRHAAGQCLHYQRSTGHAGPIHPECKPYAALIERDKEDVKAGKETPSSALEADLDYSAWMAGETARKPFDALTNSRKQDFFAQFGLNEWAAPDMGDALTIVHGGIKAREEGQQGPWQRRQNRALDGTDPGSEPANFHYAAVIMTSGSDYVTFENVTGGEPDGWYFQLYGQRHEEDQSFHAQWKEIAGNRPTTMVLRPVDLGSD